jgi:hypothetical protein
MHACGAWLLGWDSAGVFFSNGIFVNLINYINNKQTSLKLLKRTKNTRTVSRMDILGISSVFSSSKVTTKSKNTLYVAS